MSEHRVQHLSAFTVALMLLCGLVTACHPTGAVIVGTIKLPDGSAIGNVEIAAFGATTDSSPITQTTTNLSGSFSITTSALSNGVYFLRIGADWWAGSGLSADPGEAAAVTVDASSAPVTVNAQIAVASTIAGVLHGSGHQPLSAHTMVLEAADGNLVALATTDANGGFSFSLASPGDYRIDVVDSVGGGLTRIGERSYTVNEGQHLDVGTLAVFTEPPDLQLLGTRNSIGGDATSYPDQPGLIRPDMSPGYWASVEAPGTDVANGDQYNPRCDGTTTAGECTAGAVNPSHDPGGQYYTLRFDSSVPKLILQVFDAGFDLRATREGAGDASYGSSRMAWSTNYEVLAPDATPGDPTDNPALSAGDCGGGVGNDDNSGSWHITANNISSAASTFKDQWRTICTLTNPAPTGGTGPFLLRVWTSSSGIQGDGLNNFALRAIGATSTTVDATRYPASPVADSDQPQLAARSHATITASLPQGRIIFPVVKVGPQNAGHTLVLDLFDIGEGSSLGVTVNSPFGVQRGCVTATKTLAGAVSNLTAIPPLVDCAIRTSPVLYEGRILAIQIAIPANYTCDEAVNPAAIDASTFAGGGCWWSITYSGQSSSHDTTTWNAHVL